MLRIARMQNGEDVIADIKEVRQSEESTEAIAYEFVDGFTIQMMAPTEDMFQEEVPDPLDSLRDMQLQFFPWAPLTTGRNIVTTNSVVSISMPHSNVIEGYNDVLEKWKTINTVHQDAEIDYSQTPPDVSGGETDGDGRGAESPA